MGSLSPERGCLSSTLSVLFLGGAWEDVGSLQGIHPHWVAPRMPGLRSRPWGDPRPQAGHEEPLSP